MSLYMKYNTGEEPAECYMSNSHAPVSDDACPVTGTTRPGYGNFYFYL